MSLLCKNLLTNYLFLIPKVIFSHIRMRFRGRKKSNINLLPGSQGKLMTVFDLGNYIHSTSSCNSGHIQELGVPH